MRVHVRRRLPRNARRNAPIPTEEVPVNRQTQKTLDAAEEAVRQLAEACVRGSYLEVQDPRAVAVVRRNARRLLGAIATLKRALNKPRIAEDQRDE
jgi:hypothetical protein